MLLRDDGDGVIIIGQASHAWLSGQLARAWGNDQFPAPSPREEVCLAAIQHDIGMAEWDREPTLNMETGRPHSFLEMPLRTHIALWSAAPWKLLTQSRYAALLVSMHGTALYSRRDPDVLPPQEAQLVRGYLDDQRTLQEDLIRELDLDREELARNQRLMWTWDSMSLALCLPWDPHTATRVPSASGPVDLEMRAAAPNRFTLAPWPFRTPELEVRCEGRRLAERFDSPEALHDGIARAPLARLEFTLVPDQSRSLASRL